MNKFESLNSDQSTPEGEFEKFEDKEATFQKVRKVLSRLLLVGLTGAALTVGVVEIRKSVEYDKYVEAQGVVENERFKEVINELRGKIGNNVNYIEMGAQLTFERRNEKRESPTFNGAEGAGFSPEVVESLFADGKFYPKGFINGQVDVVNFHTGSGPSTKNIGVERDVVGEASRLGEIDIYVPDTVNNASTRDKYDNLLAVAEHELMHLNDWETNLDLSRIDRALLLKKVLERLDSPDQIAGIAPGTFEHEKIKMEDRKDETYRKAKEYYAEVGELYLDFPQWLKEKHPIDFELIEGYLTNKKSGDFDPAKAAHDRKEFLAGKFGPGSFEKEGL